MSGVIWRLNPFKLQSITRCANVGQYEKLATFSVPGSCAKAQENIMPVVAEAETEARLDPLQAVTLIRYMLYTFTQSSCFALVLALNS